MHGAGLFVVAEFAKQKKAPRRDYRSERLSWPICTLPLTSNVNGRHPKPTTFLCQQQLCREQSTHFVGKILTGGSVAVWLSSRAQVRLQCA